MLKKLILSLVAVFAFAGYVVAAEEVKTEETAIPTANAQGEVEAPAESQTAEQK